MWEAHTYQGVFVKVSRQFCGVRSTLSPFHGLQGSNLVIRHAQQMPSEPSHPSRKPIFCKYNQLRLGLNELGAPNFPVTGAHRG